jgi:hypothetical protein
MSHYQEGRSQEGLQVSYPWASEWDYQSNAWIFVNRETGQRSHKPPYQGEFGSNGYLDSKYAQAEDHFTRNAVFEGVAGAVGGAALMSEEENLGLYFYSRLDSY